MQGLAKRITRIPKVKPTLPVQRRWQASSSSAGEAVNASTIQLPALNLTVTYNGKPVSGARVTVTDINCKEAKGNLVKRIYSTNDKRQPECYH